jgi:hypothetical protein
MQLLQALSLQVTIILLPIGWSVPGLWECFSGPGWWGWYVDQTKTIYVCRWENVDQRFIQNHELWHFFWSRYMTQEERDLYTAMFNKDIHDKKRFWREYWMTNVWEDFADNFAVIEDRYSIRNFYLRKRIKFIKKIYENNREKIISWSVK